MKTTLKKIYSVITRYHIAPLLLVSVFIFLPFGVVFAQTGAISASGDEICGSSTTTACTFEHLKVVSANVFRFIIALGLPLLIVFIAYRFVAAWFSLQQGNANAYKEALAKSRDAFVGFLIIVALAGGVLFVLLRFVGVKGSFLDNVKLLSVTDSFVERAYAQQDAPVTAPAASTGSTVISLNTYTLPSVMLDVFGVEKAYAQASYSNEGRNAVLAQSPILESNCNATNMGVACIVSGSADSGKCAERDVGVESMRYYCRSDRAGAACPTGQTSYVTGNGTVCLPDAEVQRLIQAAEERYQNSAAGQLNSNGSQSTTNTNTQQPSGAATSTVSTVTCDSAFNMLGVCSLYDFILSILRLVMRFFIYPALIVMWVWTGFSFVLAQGNPDGLNKAKKWFMWAVITSFVIFMLQSFLIAARGTVERILPPAPKSSSNTNSNRIQAEELL